MISGTSHRAVAVERFLRARDLAATRTMTKRGRCAVASSAIVLASANRQRRQQRWGAR